MSSVQDALPYDSVLIIIIVIVIILHTLRTVSVSEKEELASKLSSLEQLHCVLEAEFLQCQQEQQAALDAKSARLSDLQAACDALAVDKASLQSLLEAANASAGASEVAKAALSEEISELRKRLSVSEDALRVKQRALEALEEEVR